MKWCFEFYPCHHFEHVTHSIEQLPNNENAINLLVIFHSEYDLQKMKKNTHFKPYAFECADKHCRKRETISNGYIISHSIVAVSKNHYMLR